MTARFRVTTLDAIDEIPVVGGALRWKPVRRTLGIAASASTPTSPRPGTTSLEAHDELGAGAGGHEELYLVLRGPRGSRSTARSSTRRRAPSCSCPTRPRGASVAVADGHDGPGHRRRPAAAYEVVGLGVLVRRRAAAAARRLHGPRIAAVRGPARARGQPVDPLQPRLLLGARRAVRRGADQLAAAPMSSRPSRIARGPRRTRTSQLDRGMGGFPPLDRALGIPPMPRVRAPAADSAATMPKPRSLLPSPLALALGVACAGALAARARRRRRGRHLKVPARRGRRGRRRGRARHGTPSTSRFPAPRSRRAAPSPAASVSAGGKRLALVAVVRPAKARSGRGPPSAPGAPRPPAWRRPAALLATQPPAALTAAAAPACAGAAKALGHPLRRGAGAPSAARPRHLRQGPRRAPLRRRDRRRGIAARRVGLPAPSPAGREAADDVQPTPRRP